ncbi:rho guanine nucleotide exchange factor 1 isoform X2 [Ambystoma mexicanum]|uniref:rho guanine nucleotide exchange factor 1 isoform X2 n=1 Tax=Ambystoma mexicanum TaxID=8296 RepID=UPI0037E963E4
MDSEEAYNGMFGGGTKGAAPAIIGAEDEDFENDIDSNVDDQCSFFQSIELVKDHPAYIMVFLQYVVLQFDCSPVLCFLHADVIRNLNAKEGKKQFVDFFHMFLDKGAILRIGIPPAFSFDVDRSRPDMISEDTLKKCMQEIQGHLFPEIARQLEDFRAKRVLGMTPGELDLNELESYQTKDKTITESKEKQLAEQLLLRLEEMHLTISSDEEKSAAIFSAIVAYMKHLGVKTKVADSKKSKGMFFRKKVSGKKADEAIKSKKLRILDPARWTWADSHTTDRSIVSDRKPSHPQRPLDRGDSAVGRLKIGSTSDVPEPSGGVTIYLPTLDSNDREAGTECVSSVDTAEPSGKGSPCTELPNQGEHLTDEGGENDRLTSKLGRSESLHMCERKRSQRGSSKGKQPRSRSDVDLEAAASATILQEKRQQSTLKHSSLTPEPGGAGEGEPLQSFLSPQSEETEPRVSELESDPPNWRELVDPETLLRLKKSEVKRQEVINELFITEHAHVRMLKVLLEVFYQPMLNVWFSDPELAAIFPSLEELIEPHALFLEQLKKLRQENNSVVMEIGDVLLDMFDGTEGSWFQKISSRFCSRQSFALEQLKTKQKRDFRFNEFIRDAESHPRCRRLQLKDIIPFEMQRLTKYPLLLQNIAKCTEEAEEKQKVHKAAECCRQILNHVNQEVRDTENQLKLADYLKRLDLSYMKQINDSLFNEFKSIDAKLTTLIHEGSLTWRVTKEKAVDVHALLVKDLLVLLFKMDDKLVLKYQSRNIAPTEEKQMLSPIIKLNYKTLTRDVATDHKAFYVIFSWENGAQIYELVANSVSERKIWCSLIRDVVQSIKPPPKSTLSMPRLRSTTQGGTTPTSPGIYREPSLSSAENGNSLKETLHIDEKEKDTLLDNNPFGEEILSGAEDKQKSDSFHSLESFLMANDIDVFKLTHSTEAGIPQADQALEEVLMLKRLLVRNIRLSMDGGPSPTLDPWQNPLGCSPYREQAADRHRNQSERRGSVNVHNGLESEVGAEKNFKEVLDCGETEEEGITPDENEDTGVDTVGEALSTPIVLSLEQSEVVRQKMDVLEQRIRQLKVMEEEYFHLQQVMAKFTSSQQSFT